MVATAEKADELRAEQVALIRKERALQEEIGRVRLEGGDTTGLRGQRADVREDIEDLALAIERCESLKGMC